MGVKRDPGIAELMNLLVDGVASAELICPISADIFLEILKQTNPDRLNCSVELIDSLSEGVSVLSQNERTRMELLYFVRSHLDGKKSCHEPQDFVWTKLAYVLGFTTPANSAFSQDEDLMIQKTFFDHMWKTSMADLVKTIGIEAIREMPRMPDNSCAQNAGKFSHANEASSFQDLFLAELAGGIDVLKHNLQETVAYLCEEATGRKPLCRLSWNRSDCPLS